MPRQARLDSPGTLHHVMNRGIEGRRIVDDDQDRSDLVRRLGEFAAACKKNGASLTELRSGSRRGKLPTIRVALVSNLVEDFGVALADVARQLGISALGFEGIDQKFVQLFYNVPHQRVLTRSG